MLQFIPMTTKLKKSNVQPRIATDPQQVHDLKIWVDRKLCIGAATCVAIAGKTFGLDTEAKAVLLSSANEEAKEVILDAAQACPVAAIIIETLDKKKVFPK